MTLNFPATPASGDTHNAANGLQYVFDGVKWTSQGVFTTTLKDITKLDSIASQFNGSLTTFNLTDNSVPVKPLSAEALTISLGGVIQEPQTAYTINTSAGTITFASAPATGTTFYGIVQSRLPLNSATVADGTITNAKVSATADIAQSKLNISDATTSASGFMSGSDKTKLDAIEANAINASNAAITNKLPLAGGTITGDVTFTGDSANIVFDKSDNALEFADNAKVTFGADADLQIFHDGSVSTIKDNGTGGLRLSGENTVSITNAAGTEFYARFLKDSQVELYYDNVKKIETTSDGVDVFNRLRALGGAASIHFNTDATGANTTTRAMFGLANSTNTFIIGASTNDVVLNTPHRFIVGHGSTEIMAIFDPDGAVELYHDAVKKCETSADGLDLPDNSKLQLGDSQDLQIFHDGSQSVIKDNGTGQLLISGENTIAITNAAATENYARFVKDGQAELYHNGTLKFYTDPSGVRILGDLVAVNQIYLPDSTSSTIGRLSVGADLDLQIYHDGNNSFIQNTSANKLKISADEVEIVNAANSEFLAKFVADGAAQLYYDNVKKAETSANGLDVIGNVDLSSAESGGSNTSQFKLSNFSIAQHQNVGSYRIANSGTGSFLFTANNHNFFDKNVSKNILRMSTTAVEVYHDNVKKLETTSSGITVTGSVTTQDMNMSNLNGTANEVDNTKGSWSIQEGSDNLFLINRVNGKKYKFNLTEIN